MKNYIKKLFLLAAVFCGLTSFAATWNGYTYGNGEELDTGNAAVSLSGDALLIQYKTVGTSTFKLPANATIEYLVVGGGGSAGTGNKAGGQGGSGGTVRHDSRSLDAGEYTITVGKGGTAPTKKKTNGNVGGTSSIGSAVTASGGAGGNQTSGNGSNGTNAGSYNLTGSSVDYGQGGDKSSGSSGGANTGNGGSAKGETVAGAGGSGIVVIKITSIEKRTYNLDPWTVKVGENGTIAHGTLTGSWTASADPTGKVQFNATGTGSLAFTGLAAGQTTLTIETATAKYICTITVNKKTATDSLTFEYSVGGSQAIPTSKYDYTSSSWTASVAPAGIVSLSATSGTGALTVYCVKAGTATVTIETPDTTYTCAVTVTKPTVVLTAQTFYVGDSVEIPSAGFSSATWTATAPPGNIVSLSATKGPGTLTVTGQNAGSGTLTIENDTTIYTCALTVNDKPTTVLDPITVRVGKTANITGAYSSLSWNNATVTQTGIVNLSQLSGPGEITVTGANPGQTTVRINTPEVLYTCLVTVEAKPTVTLPAARINTGATYEIPGDYSSVAWTATANPANIVTLSGPSGSVGTSLSVTGSREGSTRITIVTDDVDYFCDITVGTIDYSNYRTVTAGGDPRAIQLFFWDGINTRGFSWQTDGTTIKTGAVTIVPGNVVGNPSAFNGADATTYNATASGHTDCYTYMAHTGTLQPGVYSYRLGTTDHYAYGTFTVTTGDDPLTIFNFSDIQMKYADDLHMWQEAVSAADQALGGGRNADLILTVGDMYAGSYPSGYSSSYLKWGVTMDNMRPAFADVPFMMANGNHDTDYYTANLAENWSSGCFSVDYGGVHIATIPYPGSDNNLTSTVETWLKNDLDAASGAKWKIVAMHNGPYTTGDHGNGVTTTYVQKIAEIMTTYKVDLVIQAHDHTYSKTLPYLWSGAGYTTTENNADVINLEPETATINGKEYYINPEGTVYIGDASAGDRTGENLSYADRNGANSYTRHTYKIVTDKINVTSKYRSAGADGSYDVARPMFGVLEVNGNLLDYSWYVAETDGSATLFDTLHLSKKMMETIGTNVVVVGESVTIPYDERWGDSWTVSGSSKVQAEKVGNGIVITGLAEGETAVTVSVDMTDYVYTTYVVRQPYPVAFCQGDNVQIWYHNTAKKNWFLLINQERFEVNDDNSRGDQMKVKLFASNPNTDSYIVGTAETIGDPENPDLVVISDGENFYSYRMSVAAPRRIAVGESIDMVCSTVAENEWVVRVDEDYASYISAMCSPTIGTPSHSTTATLTGLAPCDEAIVYVDDQKHDEGEVNAQGAIYLLRTQVYGASNVKVHLSAGVSMDVAGGYFNATETTQYRVVVSNELDVWTASNLSFAFQDDKTGGAGFVATITADPAGQSGMTTDGGDRRCFIVQASNDGETWEDVFRYIVNVTYSFSLEAGITVPGFLYGAPTPWVTRSSDPLIAEVTPTRLRDMYTAQAKTYRAGDCFFISTNKTLAADYWGIKAKVYEVNVVDVDMPFNSTTNFTVECDGRYLGPWSVHQGTGTDRVSADISTTEAVQSTEVTFTSTGVKGQSVIEVSNGYHVDRFRIYVSDGTKPIVRGNTAIRVVHGGTVTLPSEMYRTAWTAVSEDSSIASVPAEGAAGQPIVVTGVAVGRTGPTGAALDFTDVTIESEDAIYVARIEVVAASEYLPPIEVGVGEAKTFPLDGPLATATSSPVVQDGTLTIDNVTIDPVGKTYTVTGRQEGQTAITFTTSSGEKYIVPVTVHQRHIDKRVNLVIGGQGTSSYSYTFDAITAISNASPDHVAISQNGNTLTFTPLLTGKDAQVYVYCFVDGLHESSVLHYWFDISALDDQGLKIWQLSDRDEANGAGYIGYKGESDIYEDPASGDLVMVFTNKDVNGLFVIPEDFVARVDILAVGGGGAGGTSDRFGYGAGGGGAGGLTYVTNRYFESGTFGIAVGRGGDGAESNVAGAAAPGVSGEGSQVTNSFGHVFASAAGGGGGGAPAAHVTGGNPGGSGGGAAWYGGVAGEGGRGIDGQGARGGKPSEVNSGAGGGGAGGAGGADSSSGLGRTIGITGENVLYSQGGKGAKSDQTAAAADGAGPGFGGDGGNAGPGGAGADGAVIVRITSLKTTVLVPVPTTNDLITSRFEWAKDKVCKPFVYEGQTFRGSDAHPYTWEEVIDHIDGTYVVNCSLGPDGETKEGVGYYTYTVYLKDGFAWDDGKASINGKRFMWTVTESLENVDAVLEVHKTVTWVDSSNATVTVTTKSSPEISGGGTPNVLFLGSLCSRHGLSDETVERIMSTMVSKANVDWFFYNNAQGAFGNTTPHSSGHFDQGADVTGLPTLSTSTHHNLLAYLTLLDERLNPASGYKYDYIVIEFDSDRLFEHIPEYDSQAAELTDRVAQYLKPYYESKSVIWVVDDWSVQKENPWGETDGFWWTPSTWNKDNPRYPVDGKWNFEVALLDPVLYLSKDNGERYATTASNGGYTYYFANRNEAQATYNYPDGVLDMLNSTIKVKPFNLFYKDKIVSPAAGLTITGATVLWCTNEVDGAASENAEDWMPMLDWDAKTQEVTFHPECGVKGASMEVNLVSNLVTAVISNVDTLGWAKCETHVVDDGTFRTSEGATYNQKTGRYEKNPNDGDAYVGMVDDYGVSVGADGSATTETEWDFLAYPVEGTAENGSIFVNGGLSNPLSVYEGSSVPVYYRGYGGYKLDSILVDNVKVDITDENIACYVFEGLEAGHRIDVTYVSMIGTVSSEAVTNVYDGDVHLYPVTLTGWDDEYDYEVRYALSETTPTDQYMSETEFRHWCETNAEAQAANAAVGEHTYWYRVFAFQPGYGETLKDPGWVWVDTGMVGRDTVTITPRDLVVHPVYYHVEKYGQPFPENVGYEIEGFVDGEDASVLGDATNDWHVHSLYEANNPVGQYETYMDGVTDGELVGNYRIVLRTGVLDVEKIAIQIGGVPQSDRLDPEDPYIDTGVDRVEKPYDGIAANLTVAVTEPTTGYTIHYRTGDDGAWSETNPTFIHAGTNKVWYAVEEPENHFAATNYQYVIITPLELTLRSVDAEKRYDTTPLEMHEVEVVGGSFVAGQELGYNFTGSQTDVGSSPNTFTCIENGHALPTDYVITTEFGTLTVTPAAIVIGDVTQPLDPNKPLDQDHNGVESVTVPYTGEGTNITVNVTLLGSDVATVLFTTNRSDATSWSADPVVLTNVCRQVVYYVVVSPNYVAVTNFALITITPRTVTVTADDKVMQKGKSEPEFTFTGEVESADPQLTDAARARIEAELATALTDGTFTATVGPGNDEEGYPIIPSGPKTMDGGNFTVVYVNGHLSVIEGADVVSLWITDHRDAGVDADGNRIVHLAFEPTFSVETTPELVNALASSGRIRVQFAETEDDLAKAAPVETQVCGETAADAEAGRIWVSVAVPKTRAVWPLLYKIVIIGD